MTLPELRDALISEFEALYQYNDDAHQMNHFDSVYACGVAIRNWHRLPYRDELIMVAAYAHDLFAWFRDTHHEQSATFVNARMSTIFEDVLSTEELVWLEHACREHRASFKGEFSCGFSELFNAADRELPYGVEALVERAMGFVDRDNPMAKGDDFDVRNRHRAITHIYEKFGTNGYARYPELYKTAFKDELLEQQVEVDIMYSSYIASIPFL